MSRADPDLPSPGRVRPLVTKGDAVISCRGQKETFLLLTLRREGGESIGQVTRRRGTYARAERRGGSCARGRALSTPAGRVRGLVQLTTPALSRFARSPRAA